MNLCEIYLFTSWVDYVSYVVILGFAIWKMAEFGSVITNWATKKIDAYRYPSPKHSDFCDINPDTLEWGTDVEEGGRSRICIICYFGLTTKFENERLKK